MTQPSAVPETEPPSGSPGGIGPATLLTRIRDHKVIQWAIAYLGVSLAAGQGLELVADALQWPDYVGRVFVVAMIVGFPIAIALAWYHGHRGLTQVGAGELMVISLLLLIGAVFFTVALGPKPPAAAAPANAAPAASSNTSAPAAETERAAVLPNSVAVLPFENLSPEESNAFFASGIHAEVISRLMKLSDLTVTPRAAVARYTGENRPIAEIAAELRVRSVLAATVRYADNRVRIAAELVEGSTGRPLWSDTYEREFADVFAIQADIAMNIANALQATFSPAEQRVLERAPTSSPAAYALYLQASTLYAGGTSGVADSAHALLDRAIALDPAFGAAYGAKAMIYATSFANTALGAGVPAERRNELEKLVRDNADRALALNPAESNARAALRQMSIPTWRWSLARRMVEPHDEADLVTAQVWLFAWMGEPLEGVRIARKAAELDVKSAAAQFTLAVTLAYAGDHSAAKRLLTETVEQAPANVLGRFWLAYNAIAFGDFAEALANLQICEQLLGTEPSQQSVAFLPELAYAYGRIGRDADARRVVAAIERLAGADVGEGGRALASLAVGNEEEALRRLEAVAAKARNHEPDLGYINVMNLKMNFLGDPRIRERRFAAALEQVRGD
ncbi:MAG TPA: hypothetical protein VFO94_20725 [Gammaproteobacteria bacterium]|nr:hypothetical protein [Gammaproteobacteria bacterium]